MDARTDTIGILHVDATEPATQAGARLGRADARFDVTSVTTAGDGLDRLSETDFDCIVSEYELPERDGLELFDAVRTEGRSLPFILFTGSGSERVASEAFSAGVTDYVRKDGDSDRYTTLAARIEAAVEKDRSTEPPGSSDHRLERILQTVPSCVVQLDRSGQFVYANERARDVLGLEQSDVTGRTYNDPEWHITDLDGNRIPEAELPFRQVRDGGERVSECYHTIEWPDGTRKILRVDGVPVFDDDGTVESVLFSLTDVTDRLDRDRELAHQQSVLQAVIETVPHGLLVVDDDREFFTFNDRFVDMWDIPADVVASGDDHEALESVLDSLERPDEFLSKVEYCYEHSETKCHDLIHLVDGRVFERYTAPVTGEDGEYYGRVWLFRDVTEREQRQARLQEQNERLEQFARVVSHDLQNPLQVAQTWLELDREESGSDHLAKVEDALDRMQRIVEDVLWLARSGEDVGETAPVDLQTTAADAWAMTGADRADATLIAAEADESLIDADVDRLQQLLENLLCNAVTHGGTPVTVTVGQLADGFYVEDDGSGIAPADRQDVFEMGYSTSSDGTGYGLSIVAQIVEAHGWEISVIDGADGGARFEITGVENYE